MDKHRDTYYAVVTVVRGQQWVENLNPIFFKNTQQCCSI